MKRTVVIEYEGDALSASALRDIVTRWSKTLVLSSNWSARDIETVIKPLVADVHALLGHVFTVDSDWDKR